MVDQKATILDDCRQFSASFMPAAVMIC